MPTKTAPERPRGLLGHVQNWWPGISLSLVPLAMLAVIIANMSQGAGGSFTVGIKPEEAAAVLIVLVGAPILMAITAWRWRMGIFDMGSLRSGEKITLFAQLGGGITLPAVVARWLFVVLIGLTSIGINIGLAKADATIGTGPRMALQTLGTLMPGVVVFFGNRQWIQILTRVVLLGGVSYTVGLFATGRGLELEGILWAGVVGLHMFAVQKALTVFGVQGEELSAEDMERSQRMRDSGMALANMLTLGVLSVWAWWNDYLPTPDKFVGTRLPAGVLYVVVPLAVMVIPVLLFNWARNHLSEAQQALLTSTAPICGAVVAFLLGSFGLADTPSLGADKWVAIVMVVLLAVIAGIDAERHKKLSTFEKKFKQAGAENELLTGQLVDATAEKYEAQLEKEELQQQLTAAEAKKGELQQDLDEAKDEIERLRRQLAECEDLRNRLTAAESARDEAVAERIVLSGSHERELARLRRSQDWLEGELRAVRVAYQLASNKPSVKAVRDLLANGLSDQEVHKTLKRGISVELVLLARQLGYAPAEAIEAAAALPQHGLGWYADTLPGLRTKQLTALSDDEVALLRFVAFHGGVAAVLEATEKVRRRPRKPTVPVGAKS